MVHRMMWFVFGALACACGSSPAPAPDTHATLGVQVEMFAPGLDHFVSARLTADGPLAVTGCVMPERAPCEESMRVVLDDDAREEIEALLGDLGEQPTCEHEPAEAGDRSYALRVDETRYEGTVPADPARLSTRIAGPCHADARLAWWIARWLVATTRARSDLPSRLEVTIDATRTSPHFVVAAIDLASSPLVVEGCASDSRSCAGAQRVTLDGAALARLGALLEDVRSEPCHSPFPSGAVLAIEAGLVYDGPCGADADLAWWLATQLVPGALAP